MRFLFQFLALLIQVYWIVILVRVLMSWINIDPYSKIATLIYDLTEPLLGPIRRILPRAGMFDFSPVVALFLLTFIQQIFTTLAAQF